MLRGLTHHWKISLAVLVAAAVNTSVLAGALIVGDSVRGSLRDITLDRLGDIELALVAERFFPEDLTARFAPRPWVAQDGRSVAPAILLPGSAVRTDTGARASQVNVHGIDQRFVDMFPAVENFTLNRAGGQIFASAVINETLQQELGADVGDAVLLNFHTRDNVPDDTLLGNKQNSEAFGTIRTTIAAVIPDAGIGRFGLSPNQAFPPNAYVGLGDLQSALDQDAAINAMFVSIGNAGRAAADAARAATATARVGSGVSRPPEDALREAVDFADLGLLIEWHDGRLMIESSEYVLRPPTLQAIEAAARAAGASVTHVTSYLATKMTAGRRSAPYSTVAALAGSPSDLATLTLTNGEPAPVLSGNEILLNEWTLNDLDTRVGETLRMEYYVVGPYEELDVEAADFVIAGVVAMTGLGDDRKLTPDYPGIEDTENIADWDPPFPLDLRAVRTADEDYWDLYGATPKAFVSAQMAEQLWSTRYGVVTSVRLTPPGGIRRDEFEGAFTTALLERLNLPQFGMRFIEVRANGLEASAGATDFSGLFIAFSFFLIASAAMLVGLLFSLGVEARAGEIGLLLSVGYTVKRVRLRMLAEGGIVGAAGALLGLAAGVAYAALMMLGLRTLCPPDRAQHDDDRDRPARRQAHRQHMQRQHRRAHRR